MDSATSSTSLTLVQRPRRWTTLALAVLLIGFGASAYAGISRRSSEQAMRREHYSSVAATVTARMTDAIQRAADFVSTAQALATNVPQLTNARFARLLARASSVESYRGALRLSYIQRVPASQMARFRALASSDPPPGVRRFALSPPGPRPYYCLLRFAASPSALAPLIGGSGGPVAAIAANGGYDWCAGPLNERSIPLRGGLVVGSLRYLEDASSWTTSAPAPPHCSDCDRSRSTA